MLHRLNMQFSIRCVVVLMVCALAASRADAADGATLFRVFLTDGTSIVSYGEEKPKHDNSAEVTRKLNRRAALVVRIQ